MHVVDKRYDRIPQAETHKTCCSDQQIKINAKMRMHKIIPTGRFGNKHNLYSYSVITFPNKVGFVFAEEWVVTKGFREGS